MAYSKSKDSYPAWVHAFVPMLAKCTQAGITTPREIERNTEAEAKKARFDIYGFINALDQPKAKKGQLESKWLEEKQIAQLARQWSISVSFNEHTSKWVLTLKQKNSREDLGAIADIISEMERELSLSTSTPAPPTPSVIPNTVPTQGEPTYSTPDERHLPEPTPFYRQYATRYLSDSTQTFLGPYWEQLPDPFADYENKEVFAAAFASSLGCTLEEACRQVGLLTFISIIWDNSRILRKDIAPAPPICTIRG